MTLTGPRVTTERIWPIRYCGLPVFVSHNTFGHLFRVTTCGESHGPALGCVVDGCPPLIALTDGRDPGVDLDRRRPGQSRFTTQRQEPDQVKILSGVLEDDEGNRSPPARRSR